MKGPGREQKVPESETCHPMGLYGGKRPESEQREQADRSRKMWCRSPASPPPPGLPEQASPQANGDGLGTYSLPLDSTRHSVFKGRFSGHLEELTYQP